MHQPLPPPRRIVTGHNADGRSCIIADGPSPAILTMPQRPGYRNANIWRTSASPAPVNAPDGIVEHRGVLPPRTGTVIRVIDIPPEDPDPHERERQSRAVFASMFPDAALNAMHPRHPGMHVTATVDYAILLQGELVAILEEGETTMRAGDILIQRGTLHAWANRSAAIARIAFVLIDGMAVAPPGG
ncbi:MAG TPA: cupin domain-containing protein [Steroidobacteraceae bacterium]|jgi:hypothetical protein|nr:cupin domain-containing protein [Steroidobacteraceae bacterium]